MPFVFEKSSNPEIILVKPKVFVDERGLFMETYKYSAFQEIGIKEKFVQDNYSKSIKFTLRGLHYQKDPMAQGKLIWCLKGRIFDVMVDIRKESSTYGQWYSFELSQKNNYAIYIPPGFAHGFLVLSNVAEVLYKCTQEYSAENERGIIWNDPDIKINWPVKNPILSERDKKHPMLRDAE